MSDKDTEEEGAFAPEESEERGEATDTGSGGDAMTDVPLSDGGGDPKIPMPSPEEEGGIAVRKVEDKKNKPSSRKGCKRSDLVAATALLVLVGLVIGLTVGLADRTAPTPPPPDDYDTAGEGSGVGSLTSASIYSSAPDDPLPWQLPSFGERVLGGYPSCDDELRSDLGQAAAYLANVVIRRNAEYESYYKGDGGIAEDVGMEPPMAEHEADGADFDAPTESAADDAGEEGGEDAWETNVQVEGVDEGDIVKSNGEEVFVAYGDRVVHLDTSGRKLSVTSMPEPDFDEEEDCKDYWDRRERRRRGRQLRVENLRGGGRKEHGSNGSRGRRTSVAPDVDYHQCHRPRARIESLLLEGDRLLVVVSGYGQHRGGMHMYHDDPAETDDRPILGDVGTTKVRVYDVNSLVPNEAAGIGEDQEEEAGLPQLKLVGSRDLPGSYSQKGGRSIGSKAYLVSHNYVDTWYHFQRHFDRWQVIYDGLSDEEYIETASQYAQEKVIPNFVDKFMLELREDSEGGAGGDCSHISRVSMFMTGDIDARSHHWWDDGVFQGLTQVTSIDLSLEPIINAVDDTEPMLVAEKSVAFVPSTWGTTVYATKDMLFLATQGYDEHPKSSSGFIEATYILGFNLDGGEGPAKFGMVGKVPGTLLNQFSLDVHDWFLRVASTTWANWICPSEEPGVDVDVDEDGTVKVETDAATTDGEVDGTEDIEPIEVDEPLPTVEEEPLFCEDTRFRGPSNQITILSTHGGSQIMNEVSQLGGLGKPGESIYSVRFLGTKGFVVTFRRIDPFYTLDLSDPTDPQAVGELSISGFSNYLHPTEDPDVLIAVGEDADERGRVLGVQMTLFGVHDFANPKLIARYNIEKSDEQWSSSDVQWDHRAFRYLRASQRVILPAEVRGYRGSSDSFDGFYIFNIDKDNEDEDKRIVLKHRISLAPDEEELWTRCYSPARLAARSMVFQGDAMLMKNHAIESHDLGMSLEGDTVLEGEDTFLWRLDMDEPATEEEGRIGECYYWW